jgi:type II secretory pathway component PulM
MMNHYKEMALKKLSQAFNGFMSSIKALFDGLDLLQLLNANKKLFAILVSTLGFLVLLILFAKPYLEVSQLPIALKISQSIHLKNLIIEFKSLKKDVQLVNQFDEKELDEFKKLLASKGIRVGNISFNANNGGAIEMQLKYVSFAAFMNLLNESRLIWHLYPIDLSVEATDSAGIVHINATLMQFRSNQDPSSSSSEN